MEEAGRLPEGKEKAEEEKSEAHKNTEANGNTNQPDAPSLSLSELSKRMHCPINYKVTLPFLYDDDGNEKQNPEESLSHIPWRLRILEDSSPKVKKTQRGAANAGQSSNGEGPTEESSPFSPWTYLELRRHQNTAWASDRLKEGNELLFINPTRAETKFLEGLDLVPDHADLLTAYAKLLITNHNDLAAAETKLKRALGIDPNHQLAQKTQRELIRIQQGRIRMQQQQQPPLVAAAAPKGDFLASRNVEVAKGNGIYSDVLMERALAMGDDDKTDDVGKEDDSTASSRRRRRRSKKDRKRKKKKKKHKRKRRRRYYSSEDDDSRSSSDSSIEGEDNGAGDKDETEKDGGKEDNSLEKAKGKDDSDSRDGRRHRKDRKRRRRHRKRRRRRYHSSESEDDDNSSRSASPKTGEDGDGDVRTSKGDEEDNSQEKTQKEERSDAASREDRHQKDTKRRRHRDDRKHRHRKRSRRQDSS